MKMNPQCTAASLQTAAVDLVKNDELNRLCMTAKNFDLKRISMDRSVRPEIASRTNQGGCWICMQMPNFCYGIALLVDWPCRTTDLQNAKRKVRRATAAAVLVLWQVGYQASLKCRRHAHGDEPTKGTTGDGAARLVSLFSRARALTRVGRRRAWPEVALTRRTATGGPPGPRSGGHGAQQ